MLSLLWIVSVSLICRTFLGCFHVGKPSEYGLSPPEVVFISAYVRSGYSALHSSRAGGWSFIHCNGAQQSHWDPCMAWLAKHVVLGSSQAEVITRCFSVSVNSQDQHVYLSVLLGKLVLSSLKQQLIWPTMRNIEVVTSWAAHNHGTCIWPPERDGSPRDQTEGEFMFLCWHRGRNKPFLFAFRFSKISIFIAWSVALVLYSLLNVYIHTTSS